METNFRLYLLNLPSFAPKNLLREFFKGADHDGHSVVEQSRPKQKGVPCEKINAKDMYLKTDAAKTA